jgi:hypothetical protein
MQGVTPFAAHGAGDSCFTVVARETIMSVDNRFMWRAPQTISLE